MKLTPEEIQKRREKIMEVIGTLNPGIATGLAEGDLNVIACSRVADYDMDSNDVWTSEENKSYPRDIVCDTCQQQVVMSNAMFRIYEHRGATTRVEVACDVCFKDRLTSIISDEKK